MKTRVVVRGRAALKAAILSGIRVAGTLLGSIALAGLAGVLPGAHAASEDEEGFEIKNFDIQGGRLVFSYGVSPKNTDIYVLDFTDLSVKPIVTTPAADDSPVWSPDGKKIVFQSEATGDREIYVVNEDGTDLTQLTSSPEADENPSWSPDGKSIVFQSRRRKVGADLYVMNADGTNQHPIIADGQRNVCPAWSPRRDEIVYSSDQVWPGWQIMIYSMSAGKAQLMSKGFGSFVRPNWSPDGGSLVFSYGTPEHLDIFKVEKGKGMAAPLVRRPGKNFDPSWDDQGRFVFFAGEVTPGKDDFQLFAFDSSKPEGSQVVQILSSKGPVRHPSYTSLPSLETLRKVRKPAKK